MSNYARVINILEIPALKLTARGYVQIKLVIVIMCEYA